ncbi:unnamed protein product, partial [Phaeothamnion confervicola]
MRGHGDEVDRMTSVSVVICTLNRADGLRATLESLRHQRHHEIEVVVVCGPSTDHTADVVAEYAGEIKAVSCPEPNLSMSRNIGIRAASGEIVAFIDDDALPEFDWLVQALPSFADDEVAGVGGIVFDHTGMSLQYRFSAANRLGDAFTSDSEPFDLLCAPGAFTFPYLQGTNALFRRSALEEIGGFDETFEYYLDETEVCARLVDAGFVLRQLPDAAVHHKFLPSAVRNHLRVVTNWYPVVKNQTYFAFRHASGTHTDLEIIDASRRSAELRLQDAREHERLGNLPPGSVARAEAAVAEGLAVGIETGRRRRTLRLPPIPAPETPFLRFPTLDASSRLSIVIISSGFWPNVNGGIARFMSDLAPALAARGHEVRVITRSDHHATVDLERGVWVHRLDCDPSPADNVAAGVLPHIGAFATAALHEVERIGTFGQIDVVYGPVWDVEVIGVLRRTSLPVVGFLATPVAVAGAHAGGFDDDGQAEQLRAVMALEREVFAGADAFHAISRSILDTIDDEYGTVLDRDRAGLVPLGSLDQRLLTAPLDATGERRVLFVGRLEVRKGIDTLLDAAASVCASRPDVRFLIAGSDPGVSSPKHDWLDAHPNAHWIDQVEFLGPVDDAELQQLYSTSHIVAVPSRYESFGLVMSEALMHGAALVSCDVGGIREFVRDGVDGLLVAPGDVPALAGALERLLDDDGELARFRAQARARFEEVLSIDACAQ